MNSTSHLYRQATPVSSSSNNSSRNATPTPRSNVHIPQAAYNLLHKSYDRPKSKTEVIRLRERLAKQQRLQKRQEREQQQAAEMMKNKLKKTTTSSLSQLENHDNDDENNNNTLQLRAEDGTILHANKKFSSASHQNQQNSSNNNQIKTQRIPGTAIQRLPFTSINDILMSNDDDNDEDGETHHNQSVGEMYQNSSLSYQELMKKFRSQRSHVHRTWEAVDAEQAHERRSRAIKRSFTTAQMTPAWNPKKCKMLNKQQQQQQQGDGAAAAMSRKDGTLSSSSSTPKPYAILPAEEENNGSLSDDYDDDNSSPILSPFSSRLLQYEMQHATINNATGKLQNDPDDNDDDEKSRMKKRRIYNELDSRFPKQQYMEERARAKFMAEVMKRRELENLEDTLSVNDQLRQKQAAAHPMNDLEESQQHMKINNRGELVPKKYKLLSASSKASKNQGVAVRGAAGDDIVNLLSPVGVMAKALGHLSAHDQITDPMEEFDDNNEDRWVTDSDDDDDDDDGVLSDPFWKKQKQLQKLINPDIEPDEHVDDAGKKLWTFDSSYKKKARPGNNSNYDGIRNPTEMQLDEEDAHHEAAKAKVKLASLFNRDPPPELLEEANRPPPSERKKPKQPQPNNNEILENPTANNMNGGPKGKPSLNLNRQLRRRGGTEDDEMNQDGLFQFVDPSANNSREDESPDERRRRRALAWRRAKANISGEENDIASELARKYWGMRMSYVDADVKKFEEQTASLLNSSPIRRKVRRGDNTSIGISDENSQLSANSSSSHQHHDESDHHHHLLQESLYAVTPSLTSAVDVSFSSPSLIQQEHLLNSKSFSVFPGSPPSPEKNSGNVFSSSKSAPSFPSAPSSGLNESSISNANPFNRPSNNTSTNNKNAVKESVTMNNNTRSNNSVTAFSVAAPNGLSSLESIRAARKSAEDKILQNHHHQSTSSRSSSMLMMSNGNNAVSGTVFGGNRNPSSTSSSPPSITNTAKNSTRFSPSMGFT